LADLFQETPPTLPEEGVTRMAFSVTLSERKGREVLINFIIYLFEN